jgi:hypothetical protein
MTNSLADPVHQLVQAFGRHAHGLAAALGRARLAGGFGGRGFGGFRYDVQGLVRLRVQRFDLQHHLVDDEDEDVLDGRARLVGDQGHVPGQVAFGRDQRLEGRDVVGDRHDLALAELAQLV